MGLTDQNTDRPYGRISSPSTPHTTVPSYLTPPVAGYGVLVDSNSLYEAPAESLFPAEFGEEFSVVISLSSWRANNAFLFSVKDSRDRLRFGIQLLPRRVVVYTAEKASIYFTYNWQDGRQHHFAVGVRTRSVTFYADCGAVQQQEQTLGRSQALRDSGGLFTLGRMNSKAAAFNGRVCQLDIYPSALAAAHYCSYLKKQCRLADTYRSPSPHHALDAEANDQPSSPSTMPFVGVVSTHPNPVKTTAVPNQSATSLSPDTALSPTVPYFEEDQSDSSELDFFTDYTTSSPWSDSSTASAVGDQAVLDLAYTTTILSSRKEFPEESTPQDDGAFVENTTPGLISPERESQRKEGVGNNSVIGTADTRFHHNNHLPHVRVNGTTLYREDQVDSSEQSDLDDSYDDVEMGAYDYGYEGPDFFYEYEDGFRGPKGEPGLPVSA